MELRLAGYFPKRVMPRPEWLKAPQVIDVCSISECVSDGPDDWVQKWLHNALGLFDTPELALRVVPAAAEYTMFAYRFSTVRFAKGEPEEWPWPTIAPSAPPETFQRLGFDAVSKYRDDILDFECSPLSCNGLAAEWSANSHCLFDTLEQAVEAARRFSIEQPEPGKYYVAEVLCAG
jgi:hypothetical protein